MKRGKRMKQPYTSPPKEVKGAAAKSGKKKSAGHNMGGLFGAGPKKTEPDNSPKTRMKERSIRMARLHNKFI